MGPEQLIADRRIPLSGAAEELGAPWQAAMPRIHAYLQACGIVDAERRQGAIVEIYVRLQSLLPLHQGENPVEIAMRETVQWVEEHREALDEEQNSESATSTPRHAALAMPEQTIDRRLFRRARNVSPVAAGPVDG
ncbi:MAG: hypothetical protein ACREQ1_06540, partial [Woeseiaceae bacterium]